MNMALWPISSMKSYFAIFGRSKVGFSLTGTDSRNNPEYVRGIRVSAKKIFVHYYPRSGCLLEMHYLADEHGFEKKPGSQVTIWHLNTDAAFTW